MSANETDMSDYLDALLCEAPPSAAAAPVAMTPVAAAPPAVAPAPPRPQPAVPVPAPATARPPAAATPAPTSTPAIASSSRWLRVVVDGASYALELLRVQEVVRLVPIVAMRGAQPAVLGAMNLRGRIVPVFDLGMWLRTGRVTPCEQSRIVVVERDDELIGLLVSAVEDVVTLGRDRIEPPLPGHAPGMVLGVARVGATPTVLFDAYALYG
jgi:purine-binding chemotaxis protein CheW